nr:probable ATP-dependent DNA helicase CHR12 [Tanacetum cinerariifolium]
MSKWAVAELVKHHEVFAKVTEKLDRVIGKDRREMLEEIMRKGTSSLGTDTPSEREINHLTARSKEEFWLFEKMDDERRQKERYRFRLTENHEVPDWAYIKPDNPMDMRGKRFMKAVDTFSELQFKKELLELMLSKRSKKNTKCVNAVSEELTAAKHKLMLLVYWCCRVNAAK